MTADSGPAPMDERTVEVNGAAVRVQARGEGPPLVYLHGSNGSGWPPGLVALAERFRVYVPEHPGFGSTDRPERIETVQDLALHYLDLFDALGLQEVNLVGQSLGGWIAAELASLCRHQLRRLVLVGAAGMAVPGERRLDQFAMSPEALTRALYHDPALAERALAEASDPSPDEVRAQVRNRSMTARLGWNPYLADPSLARRLHRVRVPTLLVWGAQDRIVPPRHAEAYAAAIPGSRVELLEACGHLPAVEQSEAFARVVGDFLAEGTEGEG